MSALRISRPGHATELVILEPAYARRMGHGGTAMGYWTGTTLAGTPGKPRRDDAARQRGAEASRRYRARASNR